MKKKIKTRVLFAGAYYFIETIKDLNLHTFSFFFPGQ